MATSFSFPLLPPSEIAACLEEMGLPFPEASLAKPEAEAVTKLFEALVMSQVGVTRRVRGGRARREAGAARRAERRVATLLHRDELQQPVFAALDALTFPELHEESVGVVTFTRHLYRLMRTAGVADFSMRARLARLRPPARRRRGR